MMVAGMEVIALTAILIYVSRLFQKAAENRHAKPLKTNSRISPIRLFLNVCVK
jgi:hypothetical protein